MDAGTRKVFPELMMLASQFCEEAAELIAAHNRREEILRREPVRKEVKIEIKKEKKEKPEKVEKVQEKIEKTEKPKEEKRPKKAKESVKLKSGYMLYLENRMKQLKSDPECQNYMISDFSKLISSQWNSLSPTEKEIWNEKSLEAKSEVRVHELIPRKSSRTDESEKKTKKKSKAESDSEDQSNSDSGESAHKKSKSSD